MTEYEKALMKNATIRVLQKKSEAGTITAKEMTKLAGEYGKVAGEIMRQQLLEEFPNGSVPEEDVRKIISPILMQNHKFVSEIAAAYQNELYRKAGAGLKATISEYNKYREDEIVKDISQRSFANELVGES